MPPSVAAAKAGVTTGEWAAEMRKAFGEYRGTDRRVEEPLEHDRGTRRDPRGGRPVSQRLGRRLRFLVGKPGLDGHSNGAEQIAFRARDCGMDIEYEGIRLTPEEIVRAAQENMPARHRAFHSFGKPYSACGRT